MGARLKNITITLDTGTAARARIHAAERNMSLSRYLGELVRKEMRHAQAYEKANRAFLAEKPIRFKGRVLTREKANDRSDLRRR